MKKLILSLFLVSITLCVSAQQATSRFHTDQTTKNMVIVDKAVTLANTDSIAPAASITYYFFTALTHAKTLDARIAYARKCDKIVLYFTCDTLTAGRVVTFGTHMKTTSSGGTMTVKTSKKANIIFMFDGVAWIEESRAVQY